MIANFDMKPLFYIMATLSAFGVWKLVDIAIWALGMMGRIEIR